MKTVSTVTVAIFTAIVDRKNLALANSLSLSDQESLPSEHVNQLRSSARTVSKARYRFHSQSQHYSSHIDHKQIYSIDDSSKLMMTLITTQNFNL